MFWFKAETEALENRVDLYFNTSYVLVQVAYQLLDMEIHINFNTSYVLVQVIPSLIVFVITKISIHHMFWFKITKRRTKSY